MTPPSRLELNTMKTLSQGRPLRPIREGEVIFRADEEGDCLYGIVEGSVRLAWDEGRQFETIGPGSSFGVGALVDPHHRRYGTATALSDGQLLVMRREEFLFATQELPMFALEMVYDLDHRLRALKARAQDLSPETP